MDVKKWLERACNIDLRIASKQERLVRLHCNAEKSTANYTPREGASGRNITNHIETNCVEIVEAEREIKMEIAELLAVKKEIQTVINQVGNARLNVLLEQKYILCKSWKETAIALDCSAGYAKKCLHKKAIAELIKILSLNSPK